MPLLSVLPWARVFASLQRSINRDDTGLSVGRESHLFGGTTLARLAPFNEEFFGRITLMLEQWSGSLVSLGVGAFLDGKTLPEHVSSKELLDKVARGKDQEHLRAIEQKIGLNRSKIQKGSSISPTRSMSSSAVKSQTDDLLRSIYVTQLRQHIQAFQLRRLTDLFARKAVVDTRKFMDHDGFINAISAVMTKLLNAMNTHSLEPYFVGLAESLNNSASCSDSFTQYKTLLQDALGTNPNNPQSIDEKQAYINVCQLVQYGKSSKTGIKNLKKLLEKVISGKQAKKASTDTVTRMSPQAALFELRNALVGKPEKGHVAPLNKKHVSLAPRFEACFVGNARKKDSFVLNAEDTLPMALRCLITDVFENYLRGLLPKEFQVFKKRVELSEEQVCHLKRRIREGEDTRAQHLMKSMHPVVSRYQAKGCTNTQTNFVKLMSALYETHEKYKKVFNADGTQAISDMKHHDFKAFVALKHELENLYDYFASSDWKDVFRVNRLLPSGGDLRPGFETLLHQLAKTMDHVIPVPKSMRWGEWADEAEHMMVEELGGLRGDIALDDSDQTSHHVGTDQAGYASGGACFTALGRHGASRYQNDQHAAIHDDLEGLVGGYGRGTGAGSPAGLGGVST